MRHYELVTILSPMLSQDQSNEAWSQINDFITNRDGDIFQEQPWGTRRLAYPIHQGAHHFLEGNYRLIRFSAERPFNQELESFLKFDETGAAVPGDFHTRPGDSARSGGSPARSCRRARRPAPPKKARPRPMRLPPAKLPRPLRQNSPPLRTLPLPRVPVQIALLRKLLLPKRRRPGEATAEAPATEAVAEPATEPAEETTAEAAEEPAAEAPVVETAAAAEEPAAQAEPAAEAETESAPAAEATGEAEETTATEERSEG